MPEDSTGSRPVIQYFCFYLCAPKLIFLYMHDFTYRNHVFTLFFFLPKTHFLQVHLSAFLKTMFVGKFLRVSTSSGWCLLAGVREFWPLWNGVSRLKAPQVSTCLNCLLQASLFSSLLSFLFLYTKKAWSNWNVTPPISLSLSPPSVSSPDVPYTFVWELKLFILSQTWYDP